MDVLYAVLRLQVAGRGTVAHVVIVGMSERGCDVNLGGSACASSGRQ